MAPTYLQEPRPVRTACEGDTDAARGTQRAAVAPEQDITKTQRSEDTELLRVQVWEQK